MGLITVADVWAIAVFDGKKVCAGNGVLGFSSDHSRSLEASAAATSESDDIVPTSDVVTSETGDVDRYVSELYAELKEDSGRGPGSSDSAREGSMLKVVEVRRPERSLRLLR